MFIAATVRRSHFAHVKADRSTGRDSVLAKALSFPPFRLITFPEPGQPG